MVAFLPNISGIWTKKVSSWVVDERIVGKSFFTFNPSRIDIVLAVIILSLSLSLNVYLQQETLFHHHLFYQGGPCLTYKGCQ